MKENKFTIYQLTFMALMAAVMCVLGPVSLSIGPVPISLTNLVIYFTVTVLGWKAGTGSYCLYMLLGMVGLPVFSGYAGGLAKIAGPTGGYLVGFILMAVIGGLVMEKTQRKVIPSVCGWVIGTLAAYALGTVWFVIIAHCSVMYALTICVFPFLLEDLLKIVIGSLLGKQVRIALLKANIVKQEI